MLNSNSNVNIEPKTLEINRTNNSNEKHQQEQHFAGWGLANFLESTSRGGVDHFMPIFAQNLGANSSQIGLMSGLFSLVSIFQLLWANISMKIQKPKILVTLGWFISFCLFIPLSLIKRGQLMILLIIRTIQGFFYSASGPTQATLIAEHIAQNERAKKVGTLTWLGLGGAFTGTLIGGFIVSVLSEVLMFDLRTSFLVLFFWTCLLGILASLIFYLSVPELEPSIGVDPIRIIEQGIIYPISFSKLSIHDKIIRFLKKFRNFWLFTLFISFFYFGVNLAAPFFIILKIEVYDVSFFMASVLTSISTILQVILGIIIVHTNSLDKIGRKRPLIIGGFLVSLGTIGVTFPYYFGFSFYNWGIITWSLMGIGWGFFNASLTVFLLDIVHPQYRMILIASYNTINGCAMFFGPIFGGVIIQMTDDILIVFLLRGIIIFFSICLLFTIKEPEIPGVMIHPIKYFFMKYFRFGTDRGSEITFPPTRVRKIRLKNWLPHWRPKQAK